MFNGIVPGGCVSYHSSYPTTGPSAVSTHYQFVDDEYLALILISRGGRQLTCSTAGINFGSCYENNDATPGKYEVRGTIEREAIFYDEVRLKSLPDNKVRIEYDNDSVLEFSSTILFVSSFTEREE